MQAGKRIRLDTSTVALDVRDGKRVATTIPAGTIVIVLSSPTNDRMVEVLCESRTLVMFVLDLKERGTDITDRTATT